MTGWRCSTFFLGVSLVVTFRGYCSFHSTSFRRRFLSTLFLLIIPISFPISPAILPYLESLCDSRSRSPRAPRSRRGARASFSIPLHLVLLSSSLPHSLMSTYLSPVPSNATWYPPTPSTTFSHSRSQTSSRSEPVHLPLPRADYPLLHSLLDSPEYRQAMNRYPELNRSPAPPPSKSSKRTPSTTRSSSLRRPSKTPSTTVSDVWSRKPTNSSNLSSSTLAASTRGGSRIASSLQAIHSPSDHSQLRSPIVPGLSPRSSSPQPWSNFAPLPPTSTATTAPLPLVNPVQRSASTSMRLPGSVTSSVVRRNGQDSFDRTPLCKLKSHLDSANDTD